MPFSLFLALRYLKPKRSAISVITLFCVIGVMLGVGALVVVMSVINGMQKKIREQLLSLEPHIVAVSHPVGDDAPDEWKVNWRVVADRLRQLTGSVTNVTAAIEVFGTLETLDIDGNKHFEPIQINALDVRTADLAAKLNLIAGTAELDGDEALIPERLSAQWDVGVGDKITVQSFRNAEEAYKMIDKWEKTPKEERGDPEKWFEEMKQIVEPAELTVAGIFRTQQAAPLFVPLHIGAEMTAKGDSIDYLGVATPDALEVGRFQMEVKASLPPNWTCQTWRERNRAYFDAVETERGLLYFLLLLIMVVAAFCIIVTLATVAIHKRREIGVIRSLGARLSQLVTVFVLQGAIVGMLGSALGVIGGLVVLALRMKINSAVYVLFGKEIMDPRVYGVSEIPSQVLLSDLSTICGIAMVVSTLAGVVPALIAAGQDPAKALRSE